MTARAPSHKAFGVLRGIEPLDEIAARRELARQLVGGTAEIAEHAFALLRKDLGRTPNAEERRALVFALHEIADEIARRWW